MIRVFLSYRREDTGQASGRLYDQLAPRLGAANVFKDHYSNVGGGRWRDQIETFISNADVIVALIGSQWRPDRLAEEGDMLRDELELAKRLGKPIVPVLVDGAAMPARAELPESLQWFTELHAQPLRDTDFGSDFQRLEETLCAALGIDELPRPSGAPGRKAARLAGLVALGAAAVTVWIDPFGWWREAACVMPPAAVFEEAGLSLTVAEATLPRLVTGQLDRAELTDALTKARTALGVKPIRRYVSCALASGSFTAAQLAHVDGLVERLTSDPPLDADGYRAWQQEHPFPAPLPPLFADIVIAEFEGESNTRFAVADRIETDLRENLAEYALERVTVDVRAVEDPEALLRRRLNRAVIAGWYDDLDLHIRVLMDDGAGDASDMAIRLELPPAGDDGALRRVIREALPDTASFVALYLIGQLKYAANEYIQGNRAFDAAMDLLPDDISIENAALADFFAARRLQVGGSDDVEAIVCGYADALAGDPTLFGAYTNMVNALIEHPLDHMWAAAPGRSRECLASAGFPVAPRPAERDAERIEVRALTSLIDYTERRAGPMPMLDFNRIVLQWNHWFAETGLGAITSRAELRPRLLAVLDQDPTIPGAHALLGILEMDEGAFDAAVERFEEARDLQPRDRRHRFNLAQALAAAGRRGEATDIFEDLLNAAPQFGDARLSLAALLLDAGEPERALVALDAVGDGPGDFVQLASLTKITRAGAAFAQGDPRSALQALEAAAAARVDVFDAASGRWRDYARALLLAALGRHTEAAELWRSLDIDHQWGVLSPDGNDAEAMAWATLLDRCRVPHSWRDPPPVGARPSEWGVESSDCLPADPLERLRVAFEAARQRTFERLFFRQRAVATGAACPFVYTRDPATGTWRFDTVILKDLVGPQSEQAQRRPLRSFDGAVLVRELEREISYIDQIVIEGVGSDGATRRYLPADPRLEAADGRYLVLEQGEELLVHFEGLEGGVEPNPEGSFTIEATGYYDPL